MQSNFLKNLNLRPKVYKCLISLIFYFISVTGKAPYDGENYIETMNNNRTGNLKHSLKAASSEGKIND